MEASPGPSPPSTTTIEEEEAGAGNNVVRVTATEDQFRSVFSNSLVSSKSILLKALKLVQVFRGQVFIPCQYTCCVASAHAADALVLLRTPGGSDYRPLKQLLQGEGE